MSSVRGSSLRSRRRSEAAPVPLHCMLVETAAKSFVEQLRLVMDNNAQQAKSLEKIQHYISQFIAATTDGGTGLKKGLIATSKMKKELQPDGHSKISEPPRNKRSSILMSHGGGAQQAGGGISWATQAETATKVEQEHAIDEFLRQESAAAPNKPERSRRVSKNLFPNKNTMSGWKIVRKNIGNVAVDAVGGSADTNNDALEQENAEQDHAIDEFLRHESAGKKSKRVSIKHLVPRKHTLSNLWSTRKHSSDDVVEIDGAGDNDSGHIELERILRSSTLFSGRAPNNTSEVKCEEDANSTAASGPVMLLLASAGSVSDGITTSEQESKQSQGALEAEDNSTIAVVSMGPLPTPTTAMTTSFAPPPPDTAGTTEAPIITMRGPPAPPPVPVAEEGGNSSPDTTLIEKQGLYEVVMDAQDTLAPLPYLAPRRFMWEESNLIMEHDDDGSSSETLSSNVSGGRKNKAGGGAAEASHMLDVDALREGGGGNWFTFSPHNSLKAYWDCAMIVTVIYIALMLPVRLAFEVYESDFEKGLDVTLDMFFIVDICLNFMAGYIDPATKDVVLDSGKIARRYASSWLLLDVISSIPTDVVDAVRGDLLEVSSGAFKMLKLMKVFRMLRVLRMHSFKSLEMSGRANPNVIRILKFVAAFSFSVHFSACAYWAVSKSQGMGSTKWVPSEEFDESVFGDKYAKSLHYAFSAILANDTKPETPTELWFSCCIMLIGLVVNATIIGSAASLLSNLNAGAVEKKKQMDGVREYMSFRKVPQSLQKRITEYYEYLWDCGQNSHNEHLFDDLPHSLHMHLRLSLSRELINNISLFQSLDPSVVLALVLRMEASIAIPDEVIVREGELGHCMYFINRGVVQVSVTKPKSSKQVNIATLKKGFYFGEIALMDAERERTATVTAATYCELYSLHEEAWGEIVDSNDEGFFEALKTTAKERYRKLTKVKKNLSAVQRPTFLSQVSFKYNTTNKKSLTAAAAAGSGGSLKKTGRGGGIDATRKLGSSPRGRRVMTVLSRKSMNGEEKAEGVFHATMKVAAQAGGNLPAMADSVGGVPASLRKNGSLQAVHLLHQQQNQQAAAAAVGGGGGGCRRP